jgi:hypothetical protein
MRSLRRFFAIAPLLVAAALAGAVDGAAAPSPGALGSVGLSINPAIGKIEESIESDIQSAIRQLFGPDARVFVSVHIKERTEAAKSPGDTERGGLDVGYVPIPLNPDGFRQPSGQAPSVLIESIDVDIHASDEVDPAVLQGAREIAARKLKSFKPTISVNKIASPKKQPSPTPSAEDKDAKKEPFDWKTLYPLISALGAALIVFVGIYLLSGALKSAGGFVSEGLKSLQNIGANAPKAAPVEVTAKPAAAEEDKSKPPAPSTALKDYARNSRLVRQILKDAPMLFVQSLGDADSDWRGLKWMLPSLADDEQEMLKRYLGPARVNRVAQATGTAKDDPTVWLQEFAERVMINKVQGGSPVEKALGAEKAKAFFLARPESLIEATKSVGSTAAWRILAEFLSRDRLEKLLPALEHGTWQLLISASDVSPEEVIQAADPMIEWIKNSPLESAKNEEKAKYYSTTLLGPVVNSLLSMPLGDGDALMDRLESSSASFAQLIREKVWTPRMLDRVPSDHLARLIKSVNNDQKTALLFGLPDTQSARLEAMVPEGMARTIVLDQVKKARARADARELKAASAICRQILDHLRKESLAGKFALAEAGAVSQDTVPMGATPPNNVVDLKPPRAA